MKKAAAFLYLFFSCLLLAAQEPYFCTGIGSKLHYERYKAGTEKRVQTTLFEIDSLCVSNQGNEVHFAVTMCKGNGSKMFGGRALQTVAILPDGTACLDFGATVQGFVKNMFPRLKIAKSGSSALMPADMKPGDILPDAHCTVKAAGVPAHFHVTDRKVLRKERITTPAGIFDCMVVRERKVEDAPFHHLDNWFDNYYARGMGYVRQDMYDRDMNLLESEVLVKIQ